MLKQNEKKEENLLLKRTRVMWFKKPFDLNRVKIPDKMKVFSPKIMKPAPSENVRAGNFYLQEAMCILITKILKVVKK